jgi:formylglycine-generating enzyme required for sulfatase activity
MAATLVAQKPFVIAQWTDALKGAGKWLIPTLAEFLVDEQRSMAERGLIATVYGTYAAELPDATTRLEAQLDLKNEPNASVEAKIALARKQSSIGVALLVMGRAEKVRPLFEHRLDPTLRSYLIDRAAAGGVDAKVLIARLDQEKDVSVRRAILLSLGEYGPDRLLPVQRQNLTPRLLQLYRDDADPGIHGASEWLLRQWHMDEELKKIDQELATGQVEGQRQWYISKQGQTMIVLANPGEFWMGEGPERHRRRIGRSFALASKEVTVEQFLRFRKEHQYEKQWSPTADCPMIEVTWYGAGQYCNWLSAQEGIPKEQWCYLIDQAAEPVLATTTAGLLASPLGPGPLLAVAALVPGRTDEAMTYGNRLSMAPNYLQRTGYRLPTEAEWEYACRAGAETAFSFGEAADLLNKHAWNVGNALSTSHPVGLLRPNDWGLCDMHGNAWEWCQEAYKEYPTSQRGEVMEDKEDILTINPESSRVLRGGAFNLAAVYARSACRIRNVPTYRYVLIGFRPARTLTP